MRNLAGLAAVAAVVAILLPAPPGLAVVNEYTEDFTSPLYEDTANTTADWNTTTGELGLFPYQPTILGAYDTPGAARGVTVAGDYAFVADYNSGLQVIDISDPTDPALLGTYDTLGSAIHVAVSGNYAFVAHYPNTLQIIDISDPTNPSLLGTYVAPDMALGVVVSGDYAFVAVYSFGLQIIDISDPANPTLLGACDTPGRAQDVKVAGDHAFVADQGSGLQIIDISDPTNPTILGTCDTPSSAFDVTVSGDYAFVADTYSGLQVIDISDVTNPTILGACDTPGIAYGVTVSGDYALIADSTSGLHVIDISDPTSPTMLYSRDTPGEAFGVTVAGDLALVADAASGLQVIEIAKPTPPSLMGAYDTPGAAQGVAVAGDHAFVADGDTWFQVIDISDPANPSLLTTYDMPGPAQDLAVSGDYLFVLDFLYGLQIVDISDPANPMLIGNHDPGVLFQGLAVAGDYAFASDRFTGLHVVDISDPTNPTALDVMATAGIPYGVVVEGDHAFVAVYDFGLEVIDISDPTNITSVGICDTYAAFDVAVAGDYAYVADDYAGLRVIDISDPTNPILAGSYNTPDRAYGVTISGDYAFVGDNESGLQVIDISAPTAPTLHGSYDTPNQAFEVTVAGDYAFVADYNSGLQVIRVFQREFFLDGNVGRSLLVDESDDTILTARLTTTQADSISWELSAEGGASWQAIAPDGSWNRMDVPGTDLMWRSTHTWTTPGVNPAVSNLILEWLYEFAPITSITDVPDDQGGLVDVTISRSAYDFVDEVSQPVTGYNIYRRVDDGSVSAKALDTTPVRNGQTLLTPSGQEAWPLPDESVVSINGEFHVLGSANPDKAASFPPGTWKLVSMAFATQSDSYIVEATTAADSTTAGNDWSVYVVTTHTTTPSVWFISLPDSGYSVDNIAPGVPQGIAAGYRSTGVTLEWDDAPETDFQYYRVYRGTDPGFIPASDNLVQEVATSAWTDPAADPWGYHYKITTLDYAGNESEAGSPESVSGVSGGVVPARTALLGAVPNPFNPKTKLSFEMATAGHARLKVYDAAGRLVATLVDEYHDAGRYEVIWDGRDAAGRMSAAGVYLYRLETSGFNEARRMTLLK